MTSKDGADAEKKHRISICEQCYSFNLLISQYQMFYTKLKHVLKRRRHSKEGRQKEAIDLKKSRG